MTTSLQTCLTVYVEARLDEKHIQSELSSVLVIRCKLSSDVKMSSGIDSKLLGNRKNVTNNTELLRQIRYHHATKQVYHH